MSALTINKHVLSILTLFCKSLGTILHIKDGCFRGKLQLHNFCIYQYKDCYFKGQLQQADLRSISQTQFLPFCLFSFFSLINVVKGVNPLVSKVHCGCTSFHKYVITINCKNRSITWDSFPGSTFNKVVSMDLFLLSKSCFSCNGVY